MEAAASAIIAAIGVGAPLFNQGDSMGCANVYADCAGRLLDTSMGLTAEQRNRLVVGLESASSSHKPPQDRAWVMRHTLDDVLASLRGGDTGGPQVSAECSLVVDFSDARLEWVSIDDRVMGGSSRSQMRALGGGVASFEGKLVTAGGGFASVRVAPPNGVLSRGLAGATGVVLHSAGSDGRAGYKLVLKTDAAVDGVSYQASLSAATTELAKDGGVVHIPFSAFQPSCRGRPVSAPPLRGEDVVQLGVMLSRFDSGGTQAEVGAGAFQLRLRRLEAYRT